MRALLDGAVELGEAIGREWMGPPTIPRSLGAASGPIFVIGDWPRSPATEPLDLRVAWPQPAMPQPKKRLVHLAEVFDLDVPTSRPKAELDDEFALTLGVVRVLLA